ncbi:MAG: hypothetical protein Q8O19_06500 [Rectinemataceae bacterium]|nr:hypothetical protein [Rectinemataceae bacterium]
MDKVCECCNTSFTPLPTVKNQRYCRKPVCQKARKNSWQKMKLASDNDYRQNQAKAQQAWYAKRPGYWKEYRARNPAYTERNRFLQKERNRRRKGAPSVIAKMDESTSRNIIPFGRYLLTPVCNPGIAKMDEWVVEISVLSVGYAPVCASP